MIEDNRELFGPLFVRLLIYKSTDTHETNWEMTILASHGYWLLITYKQAQTDKMRVQFIKIQSW